MLSVARGRPVDPLAIEILKQVDPVARALGIEYLVTGATARDILLVGVFGLETGRATRDVDLAISVDGWQFEAVRTRLVGTGAFEADEQIIHKLFHLPVRVPSVSRCRSEDSEPSARGRLARALALLRGQPHRVGQDAVGSQHRFQDLGQLDQTGGPGSP